MIQVSKIKKTDFLLSEISLNKRGNYTMQDRIVYEGGFIFIGMLGKSNITIIYNEKFTNIFAEMNKAGISFDKRVREICGL